MDFFDMLLTENKADESKDKFMKLKTDQERIIFALKYVPKYANLIASVPGLPKNAKASEKLREEGNKVFTKGAFSNTTCIDAFKLYTKSIAFAPYPSKELALAYANRSAVLLQLGLHSECIQDIDRALALNYPDNLRAKLYVRKTECLMILGSDSVEDIVKEAQLWLNKMSLNDANKKKLLSKLDTLHYKAVQTKQPVKNNSICTEVKRLDNESSLPVIASHNFEALCASDAIAIKYNKRYGRHLIATRDIKPGDVIAVEKPYALLLLRHKMQTHCSNCLKVCWANIPCKNCTYTMYCSEKCRDDEWKKCHDVECDVFHVLINKNCNEHDTILSDEYALFSLRFAVLALREADNDMKKLKSMVKEFDKCNDPRIKGFSQDGKLHSDRYISVYSLVTNIEKRDFRDLYTKTWSTCLILYHLATRTKIFSAKLRKDFNALAEIDDITFFGGLILRHQQIIDDNTFAFVEAQISEQNLTHDESRGLAIMPFCSLMNHSCDGNVFMQSRPEHMVMYAIYPIRKGEQLFVNYGAYYASMKREDRQQKLRRYFFICDCIPCQKDWPLQQQLPSYIDMWKILMNGEDRVNVMKVMQRWKMYNDLSRKSDVQNKLCILEDLLKLIQIIHIYAPMPCVEKDMVIKTLKNIYLSYGNRFELPQIQAHQK